MTGYTDEIPLAMRDTGGVDEMNYNFGAEPLQRRLSLPGLTCVPKSGPHVHV